MKGEDSIGQAINNGMDLIEKDYARLKGMLTRNYEAFDDDLLIHYATDQLLKPSETTSL